MNIINFTIFNFILYSIVGYFIEGIYSYIIQGKFIKEGFLNGPYKPMYGIAFTILVLINTYLNVNILIKLLLYFIVPTSIEFISGYLLIKVFNERYWDYSNLKYNYKGLVTLKFSFYWMILCYLGITYFVPIINEFYIRMENLFIAFDIVIVITIFIDFIYSVKEKLKL